MSTSKQAPSEDLHEKTTLRARVVELERENDLLKQAQGAYTEGGGGLQTSGTEGRPELGSLQHLYTTAPIGLCCFDTKLRYVFVNAWLAAINGLSVKEHLGRPISELLPDVAAGVEGQLRGVIETGEPVVGGTVEAETAAQPGVKKCFEHHYDAVKSADGAIVGVSCVVQEVTERKQAEEALRVKTDQLGAVSDAMIAFLDSGNWREASATILRSALEQTSSQYGFVGVVAAGSTLRILAHDGIEWDALIGRELYDQALRDYDRVGYLEFTSFENLFGKVITSGRAVVSNDSPNDPRSGGRPPGHPPLRHFLGVPILKGSEVVGMIGVANRPGGYMGTEQEKIEILCGAAGVLYDSYRRQQYEDTLERKRKRAEEALRLAHEVLEARVQERTEELLAANKSLQASEERLTLALEATSEGVWDWNIATGEMFYSPRWRKTLGFDPSEVEPHGRFWEGLVHPEDLPRFTEALNTHFEQKTELFECEVRLRTKSGEYRWILDRGQVVARDEDGKPLRMVGVDVDITERRRAEQALRITQFAVDHNSDAIYWVRSDGRISYVNHAACQASGYSYEELVSLRVPDIDPDFPDDIWGAHFLKVKEAGSMTFESHHRTKSGRLFPVEILANYLAYDDQEYLCAYVRDITQRKRAEEVLRESEERFRVVFESAPFGMAIVDPGGKPVRYNRAFQEMLGYSEQELQEREVAEFTYPDDVEDTRRLFAELREGKRDHYHLDKRYV